MAETLFSVPQGDFDLIRYPPTRDPNLRAWDAADEFLLAQLAEVMAEQPVGRVFVVNDAFGALTVGATAALGAGIEGGQVHFVTDSHIASLAMRQNVERNGLPRPSEWWVGADGAWEGSVGGVSGESTPAEGIDVVLIKVPKALALLELELVGLRGTVKDRCLIVGGGMTRDVHASTVALFEESLGPTRTTRARKKARLLLSELDLALSPSAPRPSLFELGIGVANLVNLPGVFSARRLDNGTRVLLDTLPEIADRAAVIDLGCGNGALGLAALLQNSTAQVTFIDESRLAVASAELSVRRAFPEIGRPGSPAPVYRVADCLDGLPGDSADLILCNPPFHQGRAHGDDVAWKMFTGAKRVLRPGGQIWVVGNRHLDYLGKLKRVLGNGQVMANDPKYQVIRGVA
jgi:16S rRNA (guanine1207-N2)-methyltransferase